MGMPTAAAQMYTCREFCQTPDEIVESVKKIAEIGYTALQASGMKGLAEMGAESLREVCDGEGVTICATHIPWDDIVNDFNRVDQPVVVEGVIAGISDELLGALEENHKKNIEKYLDGEKYPVLKRMPFGHAAVTRTLPLGIPIGIHTSEFEGIIIREKGVAL